MCINKKKFKGMTLVEVSVSLVILSVLVIASSVVIMTGFSIFGKNAVLRAAQNDGNNIYNLIYSKLYCSSSLFIGYSDDTSIEDVLFTDSYREELLISPENIRLRRYAGNVTMPDTLIYSRASVYENNCMISFGRISEDGIEITVDISNQDELLYHKEGLVPLLNYNSEHMKNTVCSTGEAEKIKICCTYIE